MSGENALEENWRRAGYGEDAIRGRIATWFTDVIKEEGLPFGKCDANVKLQVFGSQLYGDLVLWKRDKELREAACIIELKIPAGWTPVDNELVKNALEKASQSNFSADYYATSNINQWVLWSTHEKGSPLERRKAVFEMSRITRPAEIDLPAFEAASKTFARVFLGLLRDLELGPAKLPEYPVDEFFILLLGSIVNGHSDTLAIGLEAQTGKSAKFASDLTKWSVSQGWTAPTQFADYERVARQYLYLLLNKVLFYSTLSKVHEKDLRPIKLRAETSIQFRKELQAYFDTAQEVTRDYETIFAPNFLETIPLPDEVVVRLSKQIGEIARYDFSQLGFRDIGRIFDSLIPPTERHKLGQYYTRDDVVDLINCFCIRSAEDNVADFGCGAGTFLTRAYGKLREFNPKLSHARALQQVFGVDISKFAALLSTINLAIRELEYIDNHPQVLCRDFFETFQNESLSLMPHGHRGRGLGGQNITVVIPPLDAVVGNPPYTRREELEDFIVDYKETLDAAILRDWKGDLPVGGKASIYAWFFLHGLRFLKKSGRLGYVTPDSWMDSEYGHHLERAFLTKTRIIAILRSGVERWFPDAAVNTAITVLERCDKAEERKSNIVHFVALKVPLAELIPPGGDEETRTERIGGLIDSFTSATETVETEQFRVYPIRQDRLWELGTSPNSDEYGGSSWGRFLRISKQLDEVLRRAAPRLTLLRNLAEIELGYTTGYNPFFYLEEEDVKRWKIEDRFLTPVLKSPKDFDTIIVQRSDAHKRLFSVDLEKPRLKGTNALRYIEWGESQGIPERPYFRGKKDEWYKVKSREPPAILHPSLFGERHLIGFNPHKLEIDKKLIGVSPWKRGISAALCAYLNSTFSTLTRELTGRTGLGYGALDISTGDLRSMDALDVREIDDGHRLKLEQWLTENSQTDFRSVFEEIGAHSPEKFRPDKVAPHRMSLDGVVFEALGLTPHDRAVVYRETIGLVNDRFKRVGSVESRQPTRGSNAKRLAGSIIAGLNISEVRDFPDGYLQGEKVEIRDVPIGNEVRIGKDLSAGYFVDVGGEAVPCSSRQEASYIRYAILNGHRRVRVVKDQQRLTELEALYRKQCEPLLRSIDSRSADLIPDLRLRDEVIRLARRLIFRPNLETGPEDA
jgi:methylase of polypeptide subunit release factors